jgi:hypothetical protein
LKTVTRRLAFGTKCRVTHRRALFAEYSHRADVVATMSPTGRKCPSGTFEEAHVIRAALFGIAFFLIFTFPATWLLMLFLGNLGSHQSYWGTLPLGTLVAVLMAGAATPSVAVVRQ